MKQTPSARHCGKNWAIAHSSRWAAKTHVAASQGRRPGKRYLSHQAISSRQAGRNTTALGYQQCLENGLRHATPTMDRLYEQLGISTRCCRVASIGAHIGMSLPPAPRIPVFRSAPRSSQNDGRCASQLSSGAMSTEAGTAARTTLILKEQAARCCRIRPESFIRTSHPTVNGCPVERRVPVPAH